MDRPASTRAPGERTSCPALLATSLRTRALALVLFCCTDVASAAIALSGRGAGYQNLQYHRRAAVQFTIGRLDELLALSATQKLQIRAALQRSTDKNAAPRIRALLTYRQRRTYDRTQDGSGVKE